MGCDIHTYVEVFKGGEWTYHKHGHPFPNRDYGLYGFLADVRNYSKVPPLSQPCGVPHNLSKHVSIEYDRSLGDYCYSWVLLSELLAFDYDKTFDDRRWYDHPFDGSSPLPDDVHNIVTFREFLGPLYFSELDHLKLLGHGDPHCVRIIFWFDN